MLPAPIRLRLVIAAPSWVIADAPGLTDNRSVFIVEASCFLSLMVVLFVSLFLSVFIHIDERRRQKVSISSNPADPGADGLGTG